MFIFLRHAVVERRFLPTFLLAMLVLAKVFACVCLERKYAIQYVHVFPRNHMSLRTREGVSVTPNVTTYIHTYIHTYTNYTVTPFVFVHKCQVKLTYVVCRYDLTLFDLCMGLHKNVCMYEHLFISFLFSYYAYLLLFFLFPFLETG